MSSALFRWLRKSGKGLPPLSKPPVTVIRDYSHLLWVDDELPILNLVRRAFRGSTVCSTGEDALIALRKAVLEGRPYRVLAADVYMPGGIDGTALCREARVVSPRTRRVLVTAYSRQLLEAKTAVNECGASRIVDKPFDLDKMRDLVDELAKPRAKESDSGFPIVIPSPQRLESAAIRRQHASTALRECTAGLPTSLDEE